MIYKPALLLLIILFPACARQIAPSGGPEDKTPPKIIATKPTSGMTNVDLKPQIEIEFSEKIDNESFAQAFFISPEPDDYEIKYHGEKVGIELKNALLDNSTYVINIGTALRDNHRVQMEASFSFAFATGDSIDKGQLSGRVFDGRVEGTLIWAYPTVESESDSAFNPKFKKGVYSTQTAKDGSFSIPYMAKGTYRLFAVQDAGKTNTYFPVEDRIGMPFQDFTLGDTITSISNINFKISREDTLNPTLQGVLAKSQNLLEFRFDEEIRLPDSANTAFHIFSKFDKAETMIDTVAQFPHDKKRVDVRVLNLHADSTYLARVNQVTDLAGLALDTAYAETEFTAPSQSDTVRPRILAISPNENAKLVNLSSSVKIIFNEWMQQNTNSIISLYDSTGRTLSGQVTWEDPFTVQFNPYSLLKAMMLFTVKVDTLQFQDLAGNSLFDTTKVRTFTTINPDTFTAITGHFSDQRKKSIKPGEADVVLSATNLDIQDVAYSTVVDSAQRFFFNNILPGKYVLSGFVDENKNNLFDYGKLTPFHYSEYFFQYADTISVRSKWPNEGEHIILTD